MVSLPLERPIPQATAPAPTAAAPLLRVELVTSLAAFEALEAPWQEMLAAAGCAALSLDHGWLMVWLRHFPVERLRVVLVYDGLQLVAAAPLVIHRGRRGLANRCVRTLQLIGSDPTVYDAMTFPCSLPLDKAVAWRHIAGALWDIRHEWDVCHLPYLEDPLLAETLADTLRGLGMACTVEADETIPMLPLPATQAARQQEMGKSLKKDLRAAINRLNADHPGQAFVHEELLPERVPLAVLDAELEAFCERHTQYWQERGGRSDFDRYPALKAFYRDVLLLPPESHRSRLVFSRLTLGSKTVSVSLDSWQGDTLLCHITNYDTAFRWYRPGVVHMERLLETAIAGGLRFFALGRGDEGYKAKWTRDKQSTWRFTASRTPFSAWLFRLDDHIKASLKALRRKESV